MTAHTGIAGLLARIISRRGAGPLGRLARPEIEAWVVPVALEALEGRRLLSVTMVPGVPLPDPPIVHVTPPAVVPVVSVARGADASENDPTGAGMGSFTISRDQADAAVTVNFKLTGTARRGADYVVKYNGATVKKNCITLAAGQTEATLAVVPIDDHQAEDTESVALTLLPRANYVLAAGPTVARVALTDNEATVSVTQIADAMESGAAGEPGNSGGFRFSRSDTSGALTVYFQRSGTASPGARGGGDYTLSVNGENVRGNSVVIPDGQSIVDVTVNAVADTRVEGVETLELALLGKKTYHVDAVAANRTAVVNISDNAPVQVTQIIGDWWSQDHEGTLNGNAGTVAGGIAVDNGGLLLGGTGTLGYTGGTQVGGGSVGYAYQYDFTLNPPAVIIDTSNTGDSTLIINTGPSNSIIQGGSGTLTLTGGTSDATLNYAYPCMVTVTDPSADQVEFISLGNPAGVTLDNSNACTLNLGGDFNSVLTGPNFSTVVFTSDSGTIDNTGSPAVTITTATDSTTVVPEPMVVTATTTEPVLTSV